MDTIIKASTDDKRERQLALREKLLEIEKIG